MTWKHDVDQLAQEARNVLLEYDLPTKPDDLLKAINTITVDRAYISAAYNVIFSYDRMKQSIIDNEIDRALESLFNVCSAHEELWLYTTVPNESEKKERATFKNRPILTDEINNMLIRDQNNRIKLKNNGGQNKTPQAKIDDWQNEVDKLMRKFPEMKKNSATKHVAKDTGDSYHTIIKKIK